MPRTWPACTKLVWSSTTNFIFLLNFQHKCFQARDCIMLFSGLFCSQHIPGHTLTDDSCLDSQSGRTEKQTVCAVTFVKVSNRFFFYEELELKNFFKIYFYCHPCKTIQLLFMHLVTSEEKQEKQKSWSNNNYTFFADRCKKKSCVECSLHN